MKVMLEKNSLENIKWTISNFFEEWIYPGYYLKNLLFHRYDRIKIKGLKPYEYYDKNYLMFMSNMQLIVDFIEKEKPESHICWYKDDNGNDVGHKYGECKNTIPIMFPEYEGKWIMDIIKEIYNWYKIEFPKLLKEQDDFMNFYLEEHVGELDFKECSLNPEDLLEVCFNKENCSKTIEEIKKKDYNFETIRKYLPNEEDWLNKNKVREKFHFIEDEIERQRLKYTHLCIEVMDYLWT